MRRYLKTLRSYIEVVFFPDKEDRELNPEWKFKSNVFKRYAYYTIEDMVGYDEKQSAWVDYPMPAPFRWPGKLYWRLLHIWQVKIRKTHV